MNFSFTKLHLTEPNLFTMKKIRNFLALGLFLAAITLPVFEAKSEPNNPWLCYTGKKGEVGTWREGACIETDVDPECQICWSLEDEE